LGFTRFVGDVFGAPDDHALCHAVGQDLLMSAGVAKEFVHRFRGREAMQEQQRRQQLSVGDIVWLLHPDRLIIDSITKPLSKVNPTPRVS